MKQGEAVNMKIAFWSHVHGQSGTTSNMLAIAVITGFLHKKSCIVTQTQFKLNNLEAPLVGSNATNKESTDYFRNVGLDALFRLFKVGYIDRELIENCSITLNHRYLSLLPGSMSNNMEYFNQSMKFGLSKVIESLELYKDIVFLDTNAGDHELSIKMMEEADITIINLNQNLTMIQKYFSDYEKYVQGNVFYLFGNYDRNSKYNIKNIRRIYRNKINPNNSAVVPYNTNYLDAQSDGKLIDFIQNNLNCEKTDPNFYFIKNIKDASNKILNNTIPKRQGGEDQTG
ncbi:MAG: hypothetical protein K0S47_4087 [Herbinix sp.]|jgi:cellulose biosynthesis protein BcsQ|nr:hypothetical protein [Herbinix sp.]